MKGSSTGCIKGFGINLLEEDVPDATTPLKFRHLLEKHAVSFSLMICF
jgi:hypothetical protein